MTAQITIVTLLWLVAALFVTVTVGLVAGFLALRVPVGTLREQIRTARYAFDYDNALEWAGVGSKERRALLGDLRRNIADAAEDGGVSAAIERIGPARELARSVAIGRKLPRWPAGVVAALTAGVLIQLTILIAFDAFTAAAEASAAGHVEASSSLMPGIVFDYASDSIGVEFGVASWWVWALPLVAFVIWSRLWRVLSLRNTDSVHV